MMKLMTCERNIQTFEAERLRRFGDQIDDAAGGEKMECSCSK